MISPTAQKTAERIAALRQKRGMTQSQLAKRLGVSRACVASWENCVHMPKASMLCAMSECFRVSLDYLCGCADTEHADTYICIEELNEIGKEMLLRYYNFLLEQKEYRIQKKTHPEVAE